MNLSYKWTRQGFRTAAVLTAVFSCLVSCAPHKQVRPQSIGIGRLTLNIAYTIPNKGETKIYSENSCSNTAKKQGYCPPEIVYEAMQKAVITRRDSVFHVYSNIRADYRIIGYERPDTSSRKMILFSVFTSDVKGNPFRCPYGAYYGSTLGDELVIKYTAKHESFIQARISGQNIQPATVYFENKWVDFEE